MGMQIWKAQEGLSVIGAVHVSYSSGYKWAGVVLQKILHTAVAFMHLHT